MSGSGGSASGAARAKEADRADRADRAIRRRRPEVLVAPLVTLGAILGMLIVARLPEPLAWHSQPCGFREAFSRPCPACGGTRAARAMARGEVATAWRSNPVVPAGAGIALCWLLARGRRYWAGEGPLPWAEARRRVKIAALATATLFLLNWAYLWFVLEP